MGSYIPSTPAERLEMLKAIGLNDFKDLYRDVPASMYLDKPLNIPEGMSELEVSRAMSEMAAKNTMFNTILRGAGAYDHYIPSIVIRRCIGPDLPGGHQHRYVHRHHARYRPDPALHQLRRLFHRYHLRHAGPCVRRLRATPIHVPRTVHPTVQIVSLPAAKAAGIFFLQREKVLTFPKIVL